ALEEDIDRGKLRQLLVYSKRLSTFEQKARLVRDAINTLLDADDDLTAMYLTERKNGNEREEDDHQEVEMLLESYHKICDEIVQASGNLITNIRNTEEIVKAILDANRNSLMLLDLKFSIGTLGLAFGTLCSSFYGMNLKNFIEESDLGFTGVTGFCLGASALVCWFALQKLRKVQRVRMWGEGGIDRHSGSQLVSHHLHASHHAHPHPHPHVHAHARAVMAQRHNANLLNWRLDARQASYKKKNVSGLEPLITSSQVHKNGGGGLRGGREENHSKDSLH
ncbi:magnesium ion transporter, partial [Ascosphaera aggregata]